MFSKACEYGIRAMIHIGNKSARGERSSLKDVAQSIDSPVAFTAKILQALAKDNIIVSTKGPTGGYEILPAKMKSVNLLEIVKTLDGDLIYHGCGLGLEICNATKPCPLHDQFVAIRNDLKSMLENTTIHDLSMDLANGISFLKR